MLQDYREGAARTKFWWLSQAVLCLRCVDCPTPGPFMRSQAYTLWSMPTPETLLCCSFRQSVKTDGYAEAGKSCNMDFGLIPLEFDYFLMLPLRTHTIEPEDTRLRQRVSTRKAGSIQVPVPRNNSVHEFVLRPGRPSDRDPVIHSKVRSIVGLFFFFFLTSLTPASSSLDDGMTSLFMTLPFAAPCLRAYLLPR